jgi:predicted transcriptional regulator
MPVARLSPQDHKRLQRLAEETGKNQGEVLKCALDIFERTFLLDALDAGFAKLQADPNGWAQELAERASWDTTSSDKGPDS